MIVFGNEYTFLDHEITKLDKKYKKLKFVNYEHHADKDTLAYLKQLIVQHKPRKIILNISTSVSSSLIHYLTDLRVEQHISFISLEHFMEKELNKCYIPSTQEGLSFLENIKPYTTAQYVQKRVIDLLGVLFIAFFSWPVMLKCKRRIRHESPGSILFRQNRVGVNGRLFICTKFRTMHENSHHDPYTRENDSRIFPYGEVMRKTRFDELPQMLNILKGEMHLIGPRAEWNILVENYEKEIPYYNERHLVRPGITGWAQVNYPYGQNIEDTKQKLMYDLYYIKYWNIFLELTIVWKTAMTVMGKKGL